MTTGQWDAEAFKIDSLKVLASEYEREHDFDADEDPSATYDLLGEVRMLHTELLAKLGERPSPPEPLPPDPNIPF